MIIIKTRVIGLWANSYKRLAYFCNLKILVQMKTCIFLKFVFPKQYFSKIKVFSKSENSFMKRQVNQECVCDINLSNPPTILSFTFYLKHKNLIPRHKPWSWSLPLKSSHQLDLVQAWSKSSLDHTVLAPKLDILSFVELCTY